MPRLKRILSPKEMPVAQRRELCVFMAAILGPERKKCVSEFYREKDARGRLLLDAPVGATAEFNFLAVVTGCKIFYWR